MFFETVKMSLSALRHNKMRTFLTVLGVIIGIASIIALMTMVQGATNMIRDQLVSAGGNKLSVYAYSSMQKQGLTSKDLQELSEIDNIDYISPYLQSKVTAVANEKDLDNTKLLGIDQNYYSLSKDALKEGRMIMKLDTDNITNVCLISSDMAETLFGKMTAVGNNLFVNGISFTIVGVLDSMNASVGFGNLICIPYTTASQTLNMGLVKNVDLYLVDTNQSTLTKTAVEDFLYLKYNEDDSFYSVIDMQIILDMFSTVMNTMSGLLTGIAAISLLVGGIGIMNMMLVSVSERTSEIGLRKALGAKPLIILLQFILEAVFISLLGGVLGLGFGIGISSILGAALNVTPAITGDIIALAVGFSAAIGLIFGIIPARRASKLNPIDALRSL